MELTHLQLTVGRIIRKFVAWWWQQPDSAVEIERYLELNPTAFDELEKVDAYAIFKVHYEQPMQDPDVEELIGRHAGIIFGGDDKEQQRKDFVMAARYGYDIHKSLREELMLARSRFEELANKWANENEALEKENKSLKKKIAKNETEKTAAAAKGKTSVESKAAAKEEANNGSVDALSAPALFGSEDNGAAKNGARPAGKG
jgi:hypothetical protein